MQREVNCIKEELKHKGRYVAVKEDYDEVLMKAAEIISDLRKKGQITENTSDSNLIDITTTDENHLILLKAALIVERRI
ncbi:MAG: hypothetical protein OEZ35_08320 [Candidatus Bathyarchaeota archaeon]|nr:hypothetical protein [Candidatus Bathyarchaeota archaeon]